MLIRNDRDGHSTRPVYSILYKQPGNTPIMNAIKDNERNQVYNIYYEDVLYEFVRMLNMKEYNRSQAYKEITESFEKLMKQSEDRYIDTMEKLIKQSEENEKLKKKIERYEQ